MLIDAVTSGTIIKVRWNQRSLYDETQLRTVHAILLNPILTNVGTMQQRTTGWKCKIVYDSHAGRKKTPYSTYYEIKWLKMCERQKNLKIVSQASVKG